MTNPILEMFQQAIGQELTGSLSPMGRWLRGRLVAAEDGSFTVEYPVREEMTNPAGVLHGGAIAAMLDDCIGMTIFALGLAVPFTSINLNIDFLRSARPGETVTARSHILRAGSAIIHAEAGLTDGEGRLLARATSNLLRLRAKNG